MVDRKEHPSVHVVVTSFAVPSRLKTLLQFLPRGVAPITVFEDPSTAVTHTEMEIVCHNEDVPLKTKPEWGGMQGIIQFAAEQTEAEWLVYVPDDVLPCPNALEWFVGWLSMLPKRVGLVQMPFWNYEDVTDLADDRWNMYKRPDLEKFLAGVKPNLHWWGPALYINVSGAGFAFRREVWEKIGGFDQRTWCLDEYLAYRMWTQTEFVCVCVPGPAWVHGGGLSTPAQHALDHAHLRCSTIEGWMDAVGKDKDTCAHEIRAIMGRRSQETGLIAR